MGNLLRCLLLQETTNCMKELIILGANGFGREVLQWAKDVNKVEPTWQIKGFLDDNLNALDGYKCDYEVLGTIKDWTPSENEEFVFAIASPKVKETLSKMLLAKGAHFATLVHPTSLIGEFCEIGQGLVVTPRAKISPNVKIGDFVTILGCGVGHDAEIDDYCTLCGYCGVNGHVKLGKRVFVGTSAVIAPSKKVGDDAYICMGSMVMTNIKAGIKVMGCPAKKLDL